MNVATSTPATIDRLVSLQAQRHPEGIAIRDGGANVTYRTLDRWAADVAGRLHDAGVRHHDRVAVMVPRSVELVTVLLGLLKAGAAYSVLDHRWPEARRDAVLARLGGPLVVGDGTPDGSGVGVSFPSGPRLTGPEHPADGLGADGRPAQIFLTSGSSGLPKAVVSPHGAMTRLVTGSEFAEFGPGHVTAVSSPVSWDAFGLELWAPLISGGSIAVNEAEVLDAAALRHLIGDRGCDTAWASGSLFNVLVEEDIGAFRGLRQLIIGGERLSPIHVRRFLGEYPDTALINGYGPVECTVFATTHRITPADCDRPEGIPIGRPVADTAVLVLAESGRPCAPGDVGEIHLGGPRLALGYLGDPQGTAERFAWRTVDGLRRRLYRTGDRGYWDENGVLIFVGRSDREVKIRGYRVAPEEIEREIASIPGVSSCVVVRVGDAGPDDGLLALYSTDDGRPREEPELRSELARSLPAHLLPDRFWHRTSWPLLHNGKLDRAALDAECRDIVEDGRGPSPSDPATSVEDLVRREFQRIVPGPFDARRSVFEQGVSSLHGIAACGRIGRATGRVVPFSVLVARPTVDGLAGWLGQAPERAADPASGHDDAKVPAELTPAQVGFLLSDELVAPETSLCLVGWYVGDLCADAFEAAVDDLVTRHPALAARYRWGERAEMDTSAPGSASTLETRRAADDDEAREIAYAALTRPLRPWDGEVLRATITPIGRAGRSLVGLAVHHVAWDGVAEQIAVSDLAAAYTARCAGRAPAFGGEAPSPSAVRHALTTRAASVDLETQRQWWRRELRDLPVLEIGRPAVTPAGPAERTDLDIPVDVVESCDRVAAATGATRFVVLLTGFAAAIATRTGADDFGVGLPVNRRGDDVLDRAVDCLIDVVCVRLRNPSWSPASAIAHANAAVTSALAAQDISLGEVVRMVNPERLTSSPLYQVMFTVDPHPTPRLDVSGHRSEPFAMPPPLTAFPLGCLLSPRDDGGYEARLTVRTDCLDTDDARRIGFSMTEWLRKAAADI
ncbi:amino acid adenylation domain-containing protein [Actinomadura sp. 7K507]|uniref:amino acid adenylation domain-containing protein n=1 Tax=Actinomadura sp. 7K507 TaxID=2530365 RepID=UPI00140534AF|nr:amino acid adenylation domain-containing protein [Actinomadura sp. 7K507]